MIFKSNQADVDIPGSDLTTVVLGRVDELGDKVALVEGLSQRSLSYNQLKQQIDHLATGLSQRSFKKGDVLAIFCPNLPEYAVIFLGVAKAGGINTTVNSI